MKNKLLILLLTSFLLSGCAAQTKGAVSPSSNGGVNEPGTGGNTDPGTGGNTGGNTDPGTGGGSSTTIDDDPVTGTEDWQENRVVLPGYTNGYTLYSCGYPQNHNNPITINTNYTNNDRLRGDWTSEVPTNWTFAEGNSYSNGPTGHYTSGGPSYFFDDEVGGLRMANENRGFQSPEFTHTGEKLEIRFKFGNVYNASKKADTDAIPLKVYFFNSQNKVIGRWDSEPEFITAQSANKEQWFYWTQNAEQVSWFEVRMPNKAHKGTQNYNYSITEVSIKSWPQA